MHFPAEKCIFPAENALSCRKCGFRGGTWQEIVRGLQGSRIKNASQLSQDTPRSDSEKVDDDCQVAIGPASSSADEQDSSEPTNLEIRSTIVKPLKGSPQNVPKDSGVAKARGEGISLLDLEALKFRRVQLEVPAACTSQGAMVLWTASASCWVLSPKSGRIFPQSFLGSEAASSTKLDDTTETKVEGPCVQNDPTPAEGSEDRRGQPPKLQSDTVKPKLQYSSQDPHGLQTHIRRKTTHQCKTLAVSNHGRQQKILLMHLSCRRRILVLLCQTPTMCWRSRYLLVLREFRPLRGASSSRAEIAINQLNRVEWSSAVTELSNRQHSVAERVSDIEDHLRQGVSSCQQGVSESARHPSDQSSVFCNRQRCHWRVQRPTVPTTVSPERFLREQRSHQPPQPTNDVVQPAAPLRQPTSSSRPSASATAPPTPSSSVSLFLSGSIPSQSHPMACSLTQKPMLKMDSSLSDRSQPP